MAVSNQRGQGLKIREFNSELWLPAEPEQLFVFFSDAANLDAITPAWLHFRILTPQPIRIAEGSIINYRLQLRGIPIRWTTRINVWRPPQLFVDEQIRGPYRKWIHEHIFEPRDGGTLVLDKVHYAVALDFVVNAWLVRPDIERIFQFRAEALRRRFRQAG